MSRPSGAADASVATARPTRLKVDLSTIKAHSAVPGESDPILGALGRPWASRRRSAMLGIPRKVQI